MSYDLNVYVGWYAEFEPSKTKVNIGKEKVSYCPTNKKHSANGKFCSTCGAEIKHEEKDKFEDYPMASHLMNETSPEEVDFMTGGLVTLEDLEKLKDSYAIFSQDGSDEIILAPGYAYAGDIARKDGFAQEVEQLEKPNEDWVALIKKVFAVEEVNVKYGFITELV